MSLKEKMLKMNSGEGIPFMQGRTKGETEELLGKKLTIRNFGFINGNDGEYVVFIVDEIEDKFYFGGSVLTTDLKAISEEEITEVNENGLPIMLEERKSKNNRKYVAVTFYPDEVADDLPF